MTAPSIAVLGATGNLGQAALPTFIQYVKEGSFKKVRILTRKPEDLQEHAKTDPNIEIAQTSYDDSESIAAALEGVDVFVSFLGHSAGAQAWNNLRDAVLLAKPTIYVVSEYGTDHQSTPYAKGPIFAMKAAHTKTIRDAGIKTIAVANGVFMPWLFHPVHHSVFGINGSTWTIPEDGSRPYAITSLRDIGRYTARMIVQAFAEPSAFPDQVFVYSEMRPFNEYANIVERVNSEKIERKYITREEIDEKFKSGTGGYGYEIFASNQTKGMDFSGRDHVEYLNPGHKYFVPDNFEEWLKAGHD